MASEVLYKRTCKYRKQQQQEKQLYISDCLELDTDSSRIGKKFITDICQGEEHLSKHRKTEKCLLPAKRETIMVRRCHQEEYNMAMQKCQKYQKHRWKYIASEQKMYGGKLCKIKKKNDIKIGKRKNICETQNGDSRKSEVNQGEGIVRRNDIIISTTTTTSGAKKSNTIATTTITGKTSTASTTTTTTNNSSCMGLESYKDWLQMENSSRKDKYCNEQHQPNINNNNNCCQCNQTTTIKENAYRKCYNNNNSKKIFNKKRTANAATNYKRNECSADAGKQEKCCQHKNSDNKNNNNNNDDNDYNVDVSIDDDDGKAKNFNEDDGNNEKFLFQFNDPSNCHHSNLNDVHDDNYKEKFTSWNYHKPLWLFSLSLLFNNGIKGSRDRAATRCQSDSKKIPDIEYQCRKNNENGEYYSSAIIRTAMSETLRPNNWFTTIDWSSALAKDFSKLLRTLLPFLLLLNMLPFLQAVASDSDASVVGGPNPEPHPWIPVVAYLEPLPRPTKAPKCDQTYVSRAGGPSNGTFTAPMLHNPTNHSRQCLYIFLAGPGQRVEVIFTSFNLRGTPQDGAAVGELPACGHEYMDIYAEVQSSDPADLINSPFGGRFCGPIPPRRRISLYRAVALSFFTNKNLTTPDIFGGRYSFINDSEFEVGQPVIGSPCSYTVNFAQKRQGSIISPTYPGAYPKDMSCTYQFIGKPSQRVRLEFRDFDLFFGGPHCPFDFVKVYDGPDNSSALVGTYCGQQRNLVLYSSESSLYVHFATLQRTANTQNRGFKGIFEFSESFVKLDFIRENDGEHIRGSECDQKILSKKESTGFVYSPNYPFPYIPKVVCRYFVYGMQDAQHLERVKLDFSIFEIPKGEHKDKSDTNCSDGYLKIYLKGQETTDSYDKFDYELCGSELPHAVVSDGPRLVMVFSSGELQGRGFKAKYSFETEYKIPGTAAPDGTCSFTYRSTSKKKGEFNSPRYPSNYPSGTNCSFLFLATPNEQVTIVFDNFKVKADSANTTGGAYGVSVCLEDWLEMYVVYRDGSDRFLGRYCGLTAPGPVESPRGAVGIRVFLHTDQENVASGFKARYIFEVAKSVFGDCGGNYSGQDSGIIISPNFPANYHGPGKGLASRACNWYITARVGYKILLNFEIFSIEGDPAARGCPAAVLRLWTSPDSEAAPQEICGEKGVTDHWNYLTQGQSARISFTTTDKTIGAQGFRIVWTEVQDSGPGPPSSIAILCESTYHFQCVSSGYCIAEKLRCDGTKNCGPGDDSDEMHCTYEAPEEDHGVLIISSIAAGSFLICLLCTLCHRKRKRRHHRHLGLHRNAAHYDSTTSATGLGSSRRHLQGGGSLSGSLHGLNSGPIIIPPAPLPPASVPPHICVSGGSLDHGDDLQDDLFTNGDRFSSGDSV